MLQLFSGHGNDSMIEGFLEKVEIIRVRTNISDIPFFKSENLFRRFYIHPPTFIPTKSLMRKQAN